MATCPVCGLELAGAVQRCPACNAAPSSAGALMNDILGTPPPPRSTAQPKPAEKAGIPYVAVATSALLWGWGCAAILALVVGALLHAIIGGTGNHSAFKTGLNFGGMLGFLLGSIWGITSALELELAKAALVGAAIGAADTTIHYFGESILIAAPDIRVYLYSMIGCGAGAAAGVFSVVLRNFRENA